MAQSLSRRSSNDFRLPIPVSASVRASPADCCNSCLSRLSSWRWRLVAQKEPPRNPATSVVRAVASSAKSGILEPFEDRRNQLREAFSPSRGNFEDLLDLDRFKCIGKADIGH